jgi:hypothetical protein
MLEREPCEVVAAVVGGLADGFEQEGLVGVSAGPQITRFSRGSIHSTPRARRRNQPALLNAQEHAAALSELPDQPEHILGPVREIRSSAYTTMTSNSPFLASSRAVLSAAVYIGRF